MLKSGNPFEGWALGHQRVPLARVHLGIVSNQHRQKGSHKLEKLEHLSRDQSDYKDRVRRTVFPDSAPFI